VAVGVTGAQRAAPLAVLFLLATTPVAAQELQYEVSFPNAVHHEAEITLSASGLPRRPVQFQMSSSSPGRYAIHEFAKNIYSVSATDSAGNPLAVTRTEPSTWTVSGHTGTVRFTYTLYADRADGTYSQVDGTHAHLDMPATFIWIRGAESWPMAVSFRIPSESRWKVATQLYPTDDATRFTAPNLQYLMDSPTELSNFAVREWTVTSPAGRFPVRLALHHEGTDAELDGYVEMLKRVVEQEIAVFGTTPQYDVGSYTFIADYLPWASGDGMEHRNSTIITSSLPLQGNEKRLLGTASHEYFHSWNVERIRPRSLEPFDFTRANMSGELWFAEGFTSYYGPLFLRRAGVTSVAEYAHGLSDNINAVMHDPGRQFASPVGMSEQAPFVDAATSIDPTNEDNTFISYYTWGSVVGLALDLTLRKEFGKPLDGFMRMMWTKYGQSETPYTMLDLQETLVQYSGNREFTDQFFAKYITGREAPDMAPLLAQAGLLLHPRNPDKAWFGPVRLDIDAQGGRIDGPTLIGSPMYEAGLDRGDVILTLDGQPLTSDSVFQAVKAAHKPGDVVAVSYQGRGRQSMAQITMPADSRLEVVTYEEAGMPVTEAIRQFRERWLSASPSLSP
jgi:predicted metalloprotease with PDZ domain